MNYTEPAPAWREVTAFANSHTCDWSQDPGDDNAQWGMHLTDPPPHNRLLGPAFARGPASGVVTIGGRTVCEWGEPDRADMTFSVTKTYLALVAGIAFDRGVLSDVHEAVSKRVPGIGFDDPHNRQVTWAQLLQFTSEWHGTCFGVPDSVDHYRHVALQPDPPDATHSKGEPRPLQTPGTYWEYNDVRINQFSLALMHLLGRPLPEVLDEAVMKPLGASSTWRWHGYDNSWVETDGKRMQSVPGGGHWGGGMQISARDQSLVGRMMLDNGNWQGRQIVSTEWIERMRTPCPIAPFYGYFTWLNGGSRAVEPAGPDSFFAMGIGGQLIWHDPGRDMVAALRWIDNAHRDTLLTLIGKAADATGGY